MIVEHGDLQTTTCFDNLHSTPRYTSKQPRQLTIVNAIVATLLVILKIKKQGFDRQRVPKLQAQFLGTTPEKGVLARGSLLGVVKKWMS